VVTPEAKRTVVRFWREQMGLSERRACGLIGLDRSTHHYERRADRNVIVVLEKIAMRRGYPEPLNPRN